MIIPSVSNFHNTKPQLDQSLATIPRVRRREHKLSEALAYVPHSKFLIHYEIPRGSEKFGQDRDDLQDSEPKAAGAASGAEDPVHPVKNSAFSLLNEYPNQGYSGLFAAPIFSNQNQARSRQTKSNQLPTLFQSSLIQPKLFPMEKSQAIAGSG